MLADKGEESINLLKEILSQTKFDDEIAIAKVLRQRCISVEREVMTNGDDIAEIYSAKGLSRRWTSRDLMHGHAQLKWLRRMKVDGDMAAQQLIIRYRDLDTPID